VSAFDGIKIFILTDMVDLPTIAILK